jgi:hypothetical protein
VGTWEADDPAYSRPIAAPLERCAELLGVDLAAIGKAAANLEPYIRVDGTKVWSLMQLERRPRPVAYGRVRGGYISRRRRPAVDRAGLALEGPRRRRRWCLASNYGGDMPADCALSGRRRIGRLRSMPSPP